MKYNESIQSIYIYKQLVKVLHSESYLRDLDPKTDVSDPTLSALS